MRFDYVSTTCRLRVVYVSFTCFWRIWLLKYNWFWGKIKLSIESVVYLINGKIIEKIARKSDFFLHMSDFFCNFDLLPHELLEVLCFGSEGLPKLARRTYSSYLPPATIRCGSIASPRKYIRILRDILFPISKTFLQKGLRPYFAVDEGVLMQA